MLQRNTHNNYQNLSVEEKNKKRQYARNKYRKLFIKKRLSEEEKQNTKPQIKIFLRKKRNRHQYVRNNIEIFLKKKKTKGVKMHGNGIDFFLKDSPKESAKLKP